MDRSVENVPLRNDLRAGPISEANLAATAPTTAVMAAAGDEVSAAIAALFSAHGQGFQALSARAAAFHSQFVVAVYAVGVVPVHPAQGGRFERHSSSRYFGSGW